MNVGADSARLYDSVVTDPTNESKLDKCRMTFDAIIAIVAGVEEEVADSDKDTPATSDNLIARFGQLSTGEERKANRFQRALTCTASLITNNDPNHMSSFGLQVFLRFHQPGNRTAAGEPSKSRQMVYFNHLNMAELPDEYLGCDTTTPTEKPTTPTEKPVTPTGEAAALAKKATTPTEQAATLTEHSAVPDRQPDGTGEDWKVPPASAGDTWEADTGDALEGPHTKYYAYNDAWTTENRTDYGVA